MTNAQKYNQEQKCPPKVKMYIV